MNKKFNYNENWEANKHKTTLEVEERYQKLWKDLWKEEPRSYYPNQELPIYEKYDMPCQICWKPILQGQRAGMYHNECIEKQLGIEVINENA